MWTNAPTRLSGDWFGTHERDIATTIAAMANPIGNAVGAVVPGLIVFIPPDLDSWLLYQAIASLVILGVTALVVQDGPPTPPSASAEERGVALAALEAAALQRRASRRLLQVEGAIISELLHEHAHASSASEALRRLRVDVIEMVKNRNFVLLAFGFGEFLDVRCCILIWSVCCSPTCNSK